MRSSLSLAWARGRVQRRDVRLGVPAGVLAGVLVLTAAGTSAAQTLDSTVGAVQPVVFGPDGASSDLGGREVTQQPVPRRRLDVRQSNMTSMALSWAAPGDLARVAVTLDNVGRQRVTLHWALAAPGARRVLVEQPMDLAFVPTVVARRSPRDDKLYVAGWVPESQKVIVEEWHLEPVALSAHVGDDGETRTRLEPALPDARRREVYEGHRFDGLSPLSGLACDVDGDRLWLLPEGPASHLAVLDLTRGRLAPAEDLQPLLGQDLPCRWITVGRHRWEGTVYLLQPRLPWQPRAGTPDELLVLTDTDRDGTVERIERMDRVRFAEAVPSDGWLVGAFDPPPRP